MTKKSFFERLTGATKEEILKTQLHNEEKSSKNDDLENPKKTPVKTETTVKKTSSSAPVKATENKKAVEDKEKWPPEEEGQLTIDVYQNPSSIIIKSTIAGVSPENIDISITNDMVTIRGKRTKDEKIEAENYYYQELYWGAFSRSVILPVEVEADKAKAGIKNGILTIKLPKSEKIKTKKIQVKPME